MDRRNALRLFGGAGLVAVVGCSSNDSATPAASTSSAASQTDCSLIPEETAGPFPGDGSNGPNVLGQNDVVRSDITSSFGSQSGVATGVPLAITFSMRATNNGCAPLKTAAVYVWHCDQVGRYSLYSQGATNQNYLRGVQTADASGNVTFQSIFPGCYAGRWPHIHFEVYPDMDSATRGSAPIATSQIALPKDLCDAVYERSGYEDSVANLQRVSLASDMVFSDGVSLQTPTVNGSVDNGLTVTLPVAV